MRSSNQLNSKISRFLSAPQSCNLCKASKPPRGIPTVKAETPNPRHKLTPLDPANPQDDASANSTPRDSWNTTLYPVPIFPWLVQSRRRCKPRRNGGRDRRSPTFDMNFRPYNS
ncbi:hypothetical protein KC19_10G020100 [Ceratodon purpureus]|uniref:Uncharacterized protein n=1 Tax=Ceratodon purpureus TaxID=3225 RepID=A0A8T0GJC0_CERPU|nr:hypothetical protein KC19_10G020100 [Ceratodon purpureus]